MDLAKHCIVRPGSNVRLKKLDPDETFDTKRNDKALNKTLIRLASSNICFMPTSAIRC
jgi:hypothetical protein